MNYYFLDGIERKGPFSLEEIMARHLEPNTMILKEGMEKWAPLTDFKELIIAEIIEIQTSDNEKNEYTPNLDGKIEYKENKNVKRGIIIFCIAACVITAGYFIYQRFALTEEMARDTSNRLFNLLTMENVDYKTFDEIYPSFAGVGSRAVFNNVCIINNVSRNSDGDYEIYATYKSGKINNYPIYLIVGREKNRTIIKTSKGISIILPKNWTAS